MDWILSYLLVAAGRVVFRRIIFPLRRQDLFISRTLIVGANEQSRAIVCQFRSSHKQGMRVVGLLDDYLPPGTPVIEGLEVLGSPTELDRVTEETGAVTLVVTPDALAWESFQEIIRVASARDNGLEIKLSPGFYEILTTGVREDPSSSVPLLTVGRVRITGLDALFKNLLDYSLGSMLLVFLFPLIVAISLALWTGGWTDDLESSRRLPILERNLVQGLGGWMFLALKFYTELLGSARRSLVDPLPVGLTDDRPCTRLGAFLYRTGLDKLPQFVNVLRGQMSLVGPRTFSAGDGGPLWTMAT